MPNTYAQVLMRLLAQGEKPETIVEKVHAKLSADGRTALWPSISRAFTRLATKNAQKNATILRVASEKDVPHARKESGAKEVSIVIDETLIGGWRLQDGEHLQDASWKKQLLTIYQNSTRV